MDIGSLFFGFRGRINRAKYWLAYFVWSLVAVGIYAVLKAALAAAGLDGRIAMLFGIGILIYLPFMLSAFAIMLKRLHDRGKGGIWLAFYFLAPLVLSLAVFGIAGTEPENSNVAKLLLLVIFGIHVFMLVDLGLLRGVSGNNRYGPDPLARA